MLAGIHYHVMRRTQLAHTAVDGLGRGDVLVRKIVGQRLEVHFRADSSGWKQGLDLRAKHQPASVPGIEQRLLAEAVARQDQFLRATVPKRDREHAPQLGEAGLAELFIQVDDSLRVRPCPERVAAREVPAVQLFEVVNLSVEHDPDRLVLIRERLAAAFDVDDGESSVRQAQRAATVETLVIGPTMADGIGHGFQRGALNDHFTAWLEDSANPAHKVS